MNYHEAKSAINRFLVRSAGWDRRPVFLDIDAVAPALRELERAYPSIRAEADALLAQRFAMPRYHDVYPPATVISAATEGNWNVYMLELLGHRTERDLAPCAALERVPDIPSTSGRPHPVRPTP